MQWSQAHALSKNKKYKESFTKENKEETWYCATQKKEQLQWRFPSYVFPDVFWGLKEQQYK